MKLSYTDSRVQVQVSDTGKGISPEFLPYVFDRFRQAENAMTRANGELGLGLSIVQQLVKLHGDSVWTDRVGVGQGATFTVQLPFLEVRSEQFSREESEDCAYSSLLNASP